MTDSIVVLDESHAWPGVPDVVIDPLNPGAGLAQAGLYLTTAGMGPGGWGRPRQKRPKLRWWWHRGRPVDERRRRRQPKGRR